jgi:membrane protease YdiL (CAAX protease family)
VAAISGPSGVRELFGRLLQWRVATGWYGVALAGPLVLWLIAAGLFFAMGDAEPSVELAGLAVFPGLFALRVFLGGGLGEELGWRGTLLPLLAEKRSALVASLWIGVLWGLWHAPAFLFQGSGKEGDLVTLLLFTVYCTALSLIFTWMVRGTGGSLLLVVLLHGTANSTENTIKAVLPALQGEATATFLYGGLILVAAVAVIPLLRRTEQ